MLSWTNSHTDLDLMWNASFFCLSNLAQDRILKFLKIFFRFVGLRSYYTLISESMADLEYLQVRFLWLGLGCFSWFEDRCSMAIDIVLVTISLIWLIVP